MTTLIPRSFLNSYSACSIVFGAGITFANIHNMKLSPKLKDNNDPFMEAQVVGMCFVKGYIYGTLSPFCIIGIGSDIVDGNHEHFRTHFIPYSVRGQDKKKSEE